MKTYALRWTEAAEPHLQRVALRTGMTRDEAERVHALMPDPARVEIREET